MAQRFIGVVHTREKGGLMNQNGRDVIFCSMPSGYSRENEEECYYLVLLFSMLPSPMGSQRALALTREPL